jgi:chondroitin AC lyase
MKKRWINKLLLGCMLALLLTPHVAVAATTVDGEEVMRLIMTNYRHMLVPGELQHIELLTRLEQLQPEKEMSDLMVLELHQRYPFNMQKIKGYLTGQLPDGSWRDINYSDKKRSGWEPRIHANRILELVELYYSNQTPYQGSKEVEAVIHKALNYWFTAKLRCLNWWYNEIGIPKALGTAFVLFDKQLTAGERAQAITLMEESKFGMTGQNKVWLAGNVMMRALLQRDYALVKAARDTIVSEIVIGREEGIQSDWSFHQHGSQQQFGNYGLAFVSAMSLFSGLFAGTPLAFDEAKLNILTTFIDRGYRPIIWNGYMDISALGRQLFHHVQLHKPLVLAYAAVEMGGGKSDTCNIVASKLMAENYPPPAHHSLTGHFHFDRSAYTVHRAPHWMASIKMSSRKVYGIESLNGDNMQGFYMGDGATFFYKKGDEYLDIFPLWDWRKIPGVTAFEDTAPVPPLHDNRPHNESDFADGCSDGSTGVSGMFLNRAGIKAHKAWVCTDRWVLCLGAGIEADSALLVTTAIEQTWKRGDLQLLDGTQWQTVTAARTWKGKKELRFYHNGTGYIIPQNTGNEVTASAVNRTGAWHNVMQLYHPKEEQGEVTTLYLRHGVAPHNASYCYLILPDATPDEVAGFDLSDIEIVRNDAQIQSVRSKQFKRQWTVDYDEGTCKSSTYL